VSTDVLRVLLEIKEARNENPCLDVTLLVDSELCSLRQIDCSWRYRRGVQWQHYCDFPLQYTNTKPWVHIPTC